MREGNPELHRQRVSTSLIGKYGNQSRRWKGDKASYAAVHIWIKKHWGKPDHCDMCRCENASRYEWSNIDWKYRRVREDWRQLCPSCHRKYDHFLLREKLYGSNCRNGHPAAYFVSNVRGHIYCKVCAKEAQRRYKNAKTNKV